MVHRHLVDHGFSGDPTAIAVETQRIDWAASHRACVPRVVESTSDWLVSERVPDDPLRSATAVELALAQAELISAITTPPPGPLSLHVTRSSRAAAAAYQWRLFQAGVDVHELRRLKRVVDALPHDTLPHGDFLPNNLLYDAAGEGLRVVDWETVSWQPRLTDALRLWPVLEGFRCSSSGHERGNDVFSKEVWAHQIGVDSRGGRRGRRHRWRDGSDRYLGSPPPEDPAAVRTVRQTCWLVRPR